MIDHSNSAWKSIPSKHDGVGFMTSQKFDENKPMWHLLPFKQVGMIVDVLTFGAKKYAPNQWQSVPDGRNSYMSAALRHIAAWAEGENLDSESGLHHLAHAGCCLLFLLWIDENQKSPWQDVPNATEWVDELRGGHDE